MNTVLFTLIVFFTYNGPYSNTAVAINGYSSYETCLEAGNKLKAAKSVSSGHSASDKVVGFRCISVK